MLIKPPSHAIVRSPALRLPGVTAAIALRLLVTAGMIGGLLLTAAPTAAQDEEASEDARPSARPLDEIVVTTARRREENLLDVPVSISSFTGLQLERMGTVDITDLQELVPNVTLEPTRGTNTTIAAFIRGVGQQDPVAGFEGGVGIYLDDVYLNRPHGAVIDVYDVARIEVLRGPQGTLYGRNTIGGAVKYVTRRLGHEPAASLSVSAGTYRQVDVIGSFALPITDTWSVGGTVASFTRDGFGRNLFLEGVENYNKDIRAARLSMEWTPHEDLFIRIAGDRTSDQSDPRQGHRLLPSLLTGAPVLGNEFNTRAGLNVPEAEQINRGVSGTLEWHISDRFTFKSITANRNNNAGWPNDFDGLPTVDLDVAVVYNDEQFSQELQLLFDAGRFSGVTGFYYLDANAFNEFDVVLGATGDLIGLPGLNAHTLGDVDTETWSLFADVTFDLSDTVELSAGGRYTEDKRSAHILRRTFLGGHTERFGGAPRDPIATATDFTGSATFTDFSPRAGIAWKPNASHNLYATYSQGFKGGGFDPRGSGAAAPDLDGDGVVDEDDIKQFLKFEPEEVTAFEVGHKATWLDGRVNTRLALFWNDYDDIQIPGSVGVDTTGDGVNDSFIGVTTNAAEARIRGVELEGYAKLSDDLFGAGHDLSATWALGFIDAEFRKFINAFGMDISDQATFQNTPKRTANLGFDYSWPLRIYGHSGTFSFLPRVAYRSSTNQFEVESTLLDQPGYTLYNASLVWAADDGRWEFGIHGRNLCDKRYIIAGWDFIDDATLAPQLGLEGTLTAFYGDPRTVTATVKVNF
jgi:iron complex outermembrane recepter protein